MKKFFSFFAALLFAGSMMATEVTFTKADFAGQGTANTGSEVSATKDGVTFTFSKGYCATESLRCYAHGALTISAESTIEKINFTTTGGKTGGLAAEVTVGATTYSVADLASQARFTEIKVTLGGGEVVPPTPTMAYYVAGSMGVWGPDEAYKLTPSNNGEYEGEFTFAANDEFKVIGYDGTTVTWFPEGMDNNFVITEAGDYKITFNPAGNVEGWYAGFFNVVKKVIPQYEVAEAIAAGLTDGTEIKVRGVVSKIEFKGTNFKTYGSANIYVNDATGAEGSFEFYNCYSMNADTFKVSVPAWDATSASYAQFTEVSDANGYTIHVGDTVIAQGKYLYYAKNSVHELNTGCFIIYAKEPDAEFPTAIDNTNIDAKVVKFFENGQLIIIKNGVRYNAQGAVVR